jgi:hypothetical protein
VRDAEDTKTQALKMSVPGAVALERGAVGVVAKAVGLNDHLPITPEEVDLVPTDARVHLWLGKAVATTDAEEETLELAAREVVFPLQIVRADEAQVESPSDGPSENRLGRGAVEVAKGALRARHGNALATGHNIGNEGVGSMDRDAAALSASRASWERDVDEPVLWLEHPPKSRRAEVADDRPLPERKYSGHAPPFEAELGVAYGVDTAMNAV